MASLYERLGARDVVKQVWRSATQDHPTAYGEIQSLRKHSSAAVGRSRPDPEKSVVRHSEHLAQAAVHVHELFGYELWYLFDDVWADAHPDLAASLLRCAGTWDPFEP